jgi:hypothetical protein
MAATLQEYLDQSAKAIAHGGSAAPLVAIATGWEKQRIAVSGSPSAGTYLVTLKKSNGSTLTTDPIAYNADGPTLQAALRAVGAPFDAITVSATGTTPNFTHDITYAGIGADIPILVVDSSGVTGGTFTVTNIVNGSPSFGAAYKNLIDQLATQFPSNDRLATTVALQALSHILTLLSDIASNFR